MDVKDLDGAPGCLDEGPEGRRAGIRIVQIARVLEREAGEDGAAVAGVVLRLDDGVRVGVGKRGEQHLFVGGGDFLEADDVGPGVTQQFGDGLVVLV